jgi:general secretion pathway protein D
VGVFAEPRTNSLILLGPQDAIKRIEDFITQSVDVDLTQPYSPLHVLHLRYADATTVANIMNEVTKFGATTEAGKNGGVRGGDKYLKPIVFTPEVETNRLIVKGDYEDFLKAKEVILELDAPQPQVAIEVLLLGVTLNINKQLGAQIRSREPGSEGLMGTTAKFQTSGLFGTSGIVENPNGAGVNRLLGNLLDLVSTGVAAGNTIISLGDSLNVWALVQALETTSNVQVLANPFLIATNKTPAMVSLGEIRRVVTGTIVGTQDVNTVGDAPAKLEVKITPQINSDGMIVLDISIVLSQFVGVANPNNAVRTVREIKTKTIVTNKEVIALGGLIQNNVEDLVTKVPILGDIPILGWFFKNKSKRNSKSNLLVLISSRIIEPQSHDAVAAFTNDHITDYTDTLNEMYYPSERRDPVNRWFFGQKNLNDTATDEFIFRQQKEALEEAKLRKDIVLPIPMAQNTKKGPHRSIPHQKTVVATKNPSSRSKRSLVNALEPHKEVRA